MPLQNSEIIIKRSALMADGSTGGGRVTDTVIPSGVKNGIFPDARQAERQAGSDKRRKVFVHFAAADGAGVIDPYVYVESPTPGADEIYIHPGTMTDTFADISPTVRHYGAGRSNAAVAIGATQISADFINGQTLGIVQAGDTLRISAQADLNDITNPMEMVTVTAVIWSTDTATITFTPALSYAFPINAKVASCWKPGDVISSVSHVIPTSAAGTVNAALATAHPVGAIYQNVTITFTSATAFGATTDAPGVNLPAGSVSAEYAPDHGGSPYFTLGVGFFGGTWASGDTVTLRVNPQMLAYWERRILPANSAPQANNTCTVAFQCETA